MSKEKLRENCRLLEERTQERLQGLSPEQQQYFLEGLVFAYDAVNRNTRPSELTPLEREQLIGNAKSNAYSKTHRLGLDAETYMRRLVETDGISCAEAAVFAARIQKLMGIALDFDQELFVSNRVAVAQIELKR